MVDQEEEQKRYLKLAIIIGIAILILWFIVSLISSVFKQEQNYIKEKSRYTYPDSNIVSILPYLTLKSDDATIVNEELHEMYNTAIKSKNSQFTYRYSISGDYLSLVAITYLVEDDTNYPYPVFKTYVFDLKTEKLLTNEELLNQFSKTEQDCLNTLEQAMQEYYQGELEEYYLDERECDYNCFLKAREINKDFSQIMLYIEDNKLKFYYSFKTYSNLGEEKFYKNEDFLFAVE